MCVTWQEHEWLERQTGSGRDPVRGAYQTVMLECRQCGVRSRETQWAATPSGQAIFALARLGERRISHLE